MKTTIVIGTLLALGALSNQAWATDGHVMGNYCRTADGWSSCDNEGTNCQAGSLGDLALCTVSAQAISNGAVVHNPEIAQSTVKSDSEYKYDYGGAKAKAHEIRESTITETSHDPKTSVRFSFSNNSHSDLESRKLGVGGGHPMAKYKTHHTAKSRNLGHGGSGGGEEMPNTKAHDTKLSEQLKEAHKYVSSRNAGGGNPNPVAGGNSGLPIESKVRKHRSDISAVRTPSPTYPDSPVQMKADESKHHRRASKYYYPEKYPAQLKAGASKHHTRPSKYYYPDQYPSQMKVDETKHHTKSSKYYDVRKERGKVDGGIHDGKITAIIIVNEERRIPQSITKKHPPETKREGKTK